jgi:hypothetical protein
MHQVMNFHAQELTGIDLMLGHREHLHVRSCGGRAGVCASWTVTGASSLARLCPIVTKHKHGRILTVGDRTGNV